MTADKRFKRLVRERMQRTGESYTAARRHFRDPTTEVLDMTTISYRPAGYDAIEWEQIRHLAVVLFLENDGRLVLGRDDGKLSTPSGEVLPGEKPYTETSLRLPLEQAGFRRQRGYPFAISEDGDAAAIWVEGNPYHGERPHRTDADWWIGDPAAAIEQLRSGGDHATARLVELADIARRSLTDEQFYEETTRLFGTAYLDEKNTNPRQGSGFGGSADDWRAGRRHLLDAIDRDGRILDVGCANGHLLECLVEWAAEQNRRLEPYGIDLTPALVEEAQARLPRWADRFAIGNALTWSAPDGDRFDFAHVLLELVPAAHHHALVEHLLTAVVKPGGRLIVSHYVPVAKEHLAPKTLLTDLGFTVAGETTPTTDPPLVLPSAWIDNPR